jgi:hypothetical protein
MDCWFNNNQNKLPPKVIIVLLFVLFIFPALHNAFAANTGYQAEENPASVFLGAKYSCQPLDRNESMPTWIIRYRKVIPNPAFI